MEVPVTALRANLSEWLARARLGEEIVVTERGTPVARLIGIDAATTIDRLTAEGVIGRPEVPRRPRAGELPRARARGLVSTYVDEQRR